MLELTNPKPPPRLTLTDGLAWFACVAFAAATLVFFHNRTWNYYDDGTYLHVADRMLHGEVLHRDVQDMHPGYVNLANAGAMWLFGNDAVSPRYFLVAMGVANAAVVYWLLRGAGVVYAATGSVAMTALSCIQFMNPAAHWYCLFFAVLTGAAMVRLPATSPRTQVVLGLLAGTVVLFRQLTGVFVGMAVLLHVLLALPPAEPGRRDWLGRALLAVAAVGLVGYVVRATDPVALVMYGVAPAAVLAWAAWRVRPGNGDVLRALLCLSLGAAIAAMPLLAYLLYHGAVHAWLDDTVFGAMSITRLRFFGQYRYWRSMVGGAKAAVRPAGVAHVLIGLFWVVAPVLPVALAVLVIERLRKTSEGEPIGRAVPPLALLGLLYFPVALHLQKYMYFFFAFPLVVVGLLAMTPALRRPMRGAVVGTVWALAGIAFVFMAGPYRRIVPGRSTELVASHAVPRCGILLEPFQAAFYRDVIALVDREVGKDESIFVMPVNSELYYLTGRRNPTRFYLTSLGLRRPGDVRSLLDSFDRSPPKLVFYAPKSGYVTPVCEPVIDWVRSRYDRLDNRGDFEVYKCRAGVTSQPDGK